MSQSADLPARSVAVQEALATAGIDAAVKVLDDSARTAAQAAAALGCEVGAIANSLVLIADGAPLLVMTSGAHRLDLGVVAAAIGATDVRMAKPAEVRDVTGQAIGGVAPVGHPAPLRTLVDEALAAHPLLWAAGGTPHTVVPLTFEQLLAVTGGVATRVAAD
ncbi:Cys-tRNA(Pro) deacylase, prolyl-tRNA editing enzyme YbaK/EbsC [Quadrisphaera granulorum]|uniref:Prolyl-tRNA editing enzyme YbaK/EbsC (Cys-tRNA(Pro) deacylase) n=1 Tax=Quadrisphaera granulorum TaxID=317664 RepID=A0A316AD85_9ACTN|nr:YbaK/EbsC family protein [Quadrisphaera granulorum]PWJ54930.1 prolyl-tRNA editing enzyme YbaK/EbsC (Cys-tRNA(Pro) deacylase) [Quadrisphaera granulorum]SZE95876.1 Cys-tRNA(Pro) deacylase, prolyl-tRNA editing enzyme YbaK/EbsC [Quadrisphaera granulorum]